jgi:hypothetical protein
MSSDDEATPGILSLEFYRIWGRAGLGYRPWHPAWPWTPNELDDERGSLRNWSQEFAPLLNETQPLAPRLHPGTNGDCGTPAFWEYVVSNAAAWPALAAVLKTYLTRRSGRKVVLYGDGGKKLLEVTGDLTAAEIEALLRTRVAPPELGGNRNPDESRSDSIRQSEGRTS